MNMKPFFEISKDENEKGITELRFDNFNADILAAEYYCVNSRCDCEEVLLNFVLGEDSKEPGKVLMHIRLNYQDWHVEEVSNRSAEATKYELSKQFIDGLSDEYKSSITANAKEAKAFAQTYVAPIDADFVRSGTKAGYSEIFGEVADERFELNLGYYHILVDDAYCMNPKCECGNTALSFVDLSPLVAGEPTLFAINYHFRTRKIEVLNQRCSKKTMDELTETFLEKSGMPALLKRRYDEMKRKGQQIIAAKHQMTIAKRSSENVIGRNDPCPCGSGKKYKKCCGSGGE
jgi:SEC-C motif domain protein